MKLLTAGQSQPLDFRTADGRLALQVRIDRHDEGVSIVVTQPTGTTLNRTFTNDRLVEGRAYVALIRDMARTGRPVWQIEQAAGTFTTAATIVNDAAQDLPEPTRLVAFRQAGTSTGAATTDPLQHVLATADTSGFITRGRTGGSSTQLIALRKRGLVELVYGYQRNQRAIIGARLTNSGVKAAA